MEETKLCNDVIEQIKDFDYRNLTKKQELLLDKLILNEELKERYKKYSLCKECKQPNTNNSWCKPCNDNHFQQNYKNWTSGNHDIDKFIQKTQLNARNWKEVIEWVEYDRFENVKYLAKGGFGTTYKAIWKDGFIRSWDSKNNQWKRYDEDGEGYPVALKCLHNSQDITTEFLKEIESHVMMNNADYVVYCYGITKDPKTNDFTMVMNYVENGNLRHHLNNSFNSMNWKNKLDILRWIACGLKEIHDNGLIHQDFHCGNILNGPSAVIYITDLGLCQPANGRPSQSSIYGVLPYVAPEVLRGKGYTQASDIYGFGVIAHEVCTGLPPYHDIAHEEPLVIRICHGLRPKSNYKIPRLILDIIEQCWDADPLKRPNAGKLFGLLWNLYYCNENSIINKQIKEADEINKQLSSSTTSSIINILSYTTHPQAVYTSKLLNFKNLPEQKNNDDSDHLPSMEFSESVKIDFTKLNINQS